MKSAVRQILLSPIPINPSPNSLFLPVNSTNWLTFNISASNDGIISEDGTNNIHSVFRQSPYFVLQDNQPYRWSVWVRPLNRRFCYLTVAPTGGQSRIVTVWGLDGQGLLDTKQIGATIANFSNNYRKVRSDVYKIDLMFTITSGASTQIPVIGIANSATPVYNANFDIPYQGLNQPSIQILANECVPV